MSDTLGRADILRMQRQGWRFPHRGVRVGNGWMVVAVDPRGDYSPEIIADPDDEPEKWADDNGPKCEGAQLALL
jgi:hypothetical protein